MRYVASNVPVSLDAMLPDRGEACRTEVAAALGLAPADVCDLSLERRSVDARKKSNVHFVTTWSFELSEDAARAISPRKGVNVQPHRSAAPLSVVACENSRACRPLVVGTGPAGLFAGLYLARAGLRPLVIERGAPVEERVRAVEAFDAGAPLDANANIQFGEGGAGTFSDGKLNTGTKSPHIRHVLEEFVSAGAPTDILVDAKPHIGTDLLVDVVRNMRRAVEQAGGEVRFYTQLDEFVVQNGQVAGAWLRDTRSGEHVYVDTRRIVLACGHSARDTFSMLQSKGVPMERKPFAVGVRIEHPQALIDQAQYGRAAHHEALGAADYKLAVHLPNGRGVYTFCMCPGGSVVAAASEEGGVCVNGMSRHARDGKNANSALLVGIEPGDLPGTDVLAGVAFQRELERAAFAAGGGEYRAPAQTVGDFLANVDAGSGARADAPAAAGGFASSLVRPTYPRGVVWTNLRACLPKLVTDALAAALPLLDAKLRGFAHPEAVMTAVEVRSSSPVRILRDGSFQSALRGLYPCGEGAGYAGGITSAAVDGLRVAEALVRHENGEGGA